MNKVERIKELVSMLNYYRNAYYNQQTSKISDYEYDQLFDELTNLEKETNFVLSNSPTITVGYEVKSELTKVKHSHPMLSLDKTKDTNELKRFAGTQDCLLSLKLDGLTILLTYDNGELIRAETRGNGEEGEVVTHNAKVFDNIPLQIDYKERLEIEGEAIITYDNFERINGMIDNPDERYKNPRNLVSGSVRQLDSNIAAQRHIKFIAWKVPTEIQGYTRDIINNSFLFRLKAIEKMGFDIAPLYTYVNGSYDEEHINDIIESLKIQANNNGFPIDGLVMTYNNIAYGESLGCTGHHPRHSIAFKFYDEVVETTLLGVEFTMGKTGVLTPTAVFKPVEIDGTTVERASVHNLSILSKLELLQGDTITVYKANQIIPQVSENLSANQRHKNGIYEYVSFPYICPICGGETKMVRDNNTNVLICTNDSCKGKLLGKLTHFVSKNAMNIDGMSEATLEKFIELGWLTCFEDIYYLSIQRDLMSKLEGFGEKSVSNLLTSINKSTNTTLDRFIYALCIPLIGRSASKTISKYFNGDFNRFYKECCINRFDFTVLDDFGDAMNDSINDYIEKNVVMIGNLSKCMDFEEMQSQSGSTNLSGLTFVITGSLNQFSNRDEAKEKIESLGGKVSGSVSAKTSFLVNNDIHSTSGKNKKAKELGIKIITEEELLEMLK